LNLKYFWYTHFDKKIGFGIKLFQSFSGGKRNEELILPLNDSISATLSTDHVANYFDVKDICI